MEGTAQPPSEEFIESEHPRDADGHFIHVDKSVTPLAPEHHDPLTDFVASTTVVKKSKDQDELIDIHVGNPLRRITQLLEDIKRQKAFTFDIKGSLGVAGIVLVLGTFGIFGGTKALCSKGTQTKIGYVRTLKYQQATDQTFWEKIPLLSYFFHPNTEGRVILVEGNGTAVRLKGNATNATISPLLPVIATGEYDACAQTLTLEDGNNSMEPAQ